MGCRRAQSGNSLTSVTVPVEAATVNQVYQAIVGTLFDLDATGNAHLHANPSRI